MCLTSPFWCAEKWMVETIFTMTWLEAPKKPPWSIQHANHAAMLFKEGT
jgi:hypothetical protein